MSHDDAASLLCGTNAGYTRHIRAGTAICEDCRGAHTLYVKLWRARGGGMNASRSYRDARGRALTRLARMYPGIYRALYLEERQRDQERTWTGDP